MDRCDECNFVYESFPLTSVPGELRSLPTQYAVQLRQADRTGFARLRPRPETWSALEYTCHLRDVFRVQRERLLLALTQEQPAFTPMRREERAVEERYNAQDVEAVLSELDEAARLIADAFESLDEGQWQRTGVYNWPKKGERPMAWLARHTVHEGVHHLQDIVRGTEQVRARRA